MLREIQEGKYLNLERRLEEIMSDPNDHQGQKLTVVMEQRPNAMLRDKSHITIADVLRIEGKPRAELEALYSDVLGPMGNRLNLLKAVSASKRVDRDAFRNGFMDLFADSMMKGGLEDKPRIKEVILYPFLVSGLVEISKNDYGFSSDLASSIRSAEQRQELREKFDAVCAEHGVGLRVNDGRIAIRS
ncbi:MAG: hypothetical protein KGI06_01615 [Candidatus Micrarchaeota archaeon]|nr:hypothetical protein [Candidatus Micrarchaeota archaeon]